MIDQNIICPNCGKEIPLTETLFNQVREGLRKEFEGESKEREAAIAAREKKVCEQQEEIQSAQNAIAKQVEERLKTEEEKIKQTARIEAETALKVEISDLKQQIFENNSKAQQAMNNELDLRRKVRDLEEQKKNVDLEIARKMDEEEDQIIHDGSSC